MKIRRKDAAVRRIAARSMHTNRTRNLFAALAILLTTFMISTVFLSLIHISEPTRRS